MAGQPQSGNRRWTRSLLRALTSPLEIDDYLELLNPLWSTREVRARVVEKVRETADAVTLRLRANDVWAGHIAGQHVLLGVEIDGVREQRCFSLSSAPSGGDLTVTVKRNGAGRVSNYLVDRLEEGELLYLGEAQGEFHLPETVPEKLLMIAGGSGITPVHAMLRELHARGSRVDVTLLYYNRTAEDAIFAVELDQLAARWPALRLHHIHTGAGGEHFSGNQLGRLVPDFSDRTVYLCGPEGLYEAVTGFWRDAGLEDRLYSERFVARRRATKGDGGRVHFSESGTDAVGSGAESVLELAEAAGLSPQHGCRMGICHTCTCRLNSGRLRNLQTGETFDAEGERVRICVHAPEGDVDLEL